MFKRVIKLVLSIVFFGLIRIIKSFTKKEKEILTVVTYHSIKTDEIQKYAKQMDELIKAGNPVLPDTKGPFKQGHHYIAVTFDDGFQSFAHHALPLMIERNIPVAVFITTGYLGERPGWIARETHRNYDELLMTREQIIEVCGRNVLIGSHSVTHHHLAKIESQKALEELSISKVKLEEIIGKEVKIFSFPHGSCNDKLIRLLKEIGYKRLFLNVPRKMGRNCDGYVFGRIDVSLNDWAIEYKLKFRGAYGWLHYVVTLKQRFKTVWGSN